MPVIKTPLGDGLYVGTQSQADRIQALINARHSFTMKYMAEQGWGDKVEDLTIDQVLEIRDQPGWQKPELD